MSARHFSASQGRPGRGRPHSTFRGRASPQTTTVGQPSGHTDDFNPNTNNPRRFPQSPGNQRARGFPPGRGGRGFRGGTGVPRIFAEGCPAVVDSRLEDIDSLITRFNENTGGQRVDMPLNPGFGTEGQEVNVRSNFFPLNIPQRSTIYDYKMIISPKLPVELRNSFSDRLVRCSELSKYKGCIAHDSSQRLVSSKMLPQPLDMSVRVEDEGRETTFNVKVVFQKPLETSDLHRWGSSRQIS